jgi:hypothetical protein
MQLTSCTGSTHATIPAACCTVVLCIQPQAQIVRAGYDTELHGKASKHVKLQDDQVANCKTRFLQAHKTKAEHSQTAAPPLLLQSTYTLSRTDICTICCTPPPPHHHCALHISAVPRQIHIQCHRAAGLGDCHACLADAVLTSWVHDA